MLTILCTVFALCGLRATAYAITGVSAGTDSLTGERPFRKEINGFATSGAAWDLYVLSLRRLQQTKQTDPLSYFQIAGIHGYPHIPWDGVNGTYGMPGYCMHAAVPFPTWHRPYLALFEQVLWSNAQNIARTYPASQWNDYVAAALTLRLPYWDWAVTPTLPDVVTTRTITVNTPEGYQEIDNPLYNYTFQSDAAGNGFPSGHPVNAPPSEDADTGSKRAEQWIDEQQMANFRWTVRHWNAPLSQSNITDANLDLLANAPTMLALTYQLLSVPSNYTSFACTATSGGLPNSANNIENIHNGIHNFIGGNPGHMVYPEVAAFDPVFWLHHANVDRLFAMWQILNPEAWVQPTIDTFGTYFEAPGFTDTADSPLAPFHLDNRSTFHTSDTARSTRPLGYTYPEIVDWNTTAMDLAASVRSSINALYNPYAGNSTAPGKNGTVASRSVNVAQNFGHVTLEMVKQWGVNNLQVQWLINVQLQRFAFPTTFTIHFFIGDPPADPSSWPAAPNLIGSHGQFIAANLSMLYSPGFPTGLQQGEVSLTHTLAAGVARGLLANLTPAAVLPLLAQNLNWRARAADGCEINLESIADLSIAVGSRQVQPAVAESEFPIYGETAYHPEATQGKCGGIGRGRRGKKP